MRVAVLIECQIPKECSFSPIPSASNEDILKVPDDIICKVRCSITSREFRQVNVLVRKSIVDGGLSGDVARIGVEGSSRHILSGDRITQHLNWIRRVVPVVVIRENFGR